MAWGECTDTVQVSRDRLGQPLGPGPGEDLNGHRKGVYRQFNMKRKTMENVDLLLKWCRRPADKPDGR